MRPSRLVSMMLALLILSVAMLAIGYVGIIWNGMKRLELRLSVILSQFGGGLTVAPPHCPLIHEPSFASVRTRLSI